MPANCPVDAFKTFQTLSGPLTDLLLKPLAINESPFIGSFAPKTVAPKLNKDGSISETAGNTAQINQQTYEVAAVQLTKPIHSGFLFPDQQASQWNQVAELVLILKSNKTDRVAFICSPIYTTANSSSYSAYLDQLYDPTKPVANLQTLLLSGDGDTVQKSISYTFCEAGKDYTVFLFPKGVQIPSANWQKIMNIIGQLPSIGSAGLVVPTSQDFKNRFQYFMKPVSLTGKFDPSSCPAYKTTQYKCVPFDRIRNLDGDTVVFKGAGTLQDRLRAQDMAKSQAIQSVSGEKPRMSATEIAAIVTGSLVGILGLVFVGSKVASYVNQE